MNYVIKAAIRNAQHPEYGKVTISFPIPDEEYAHTIELLEELDIGHALGQDCHITGLDSSHAVLSRLEGSAVNVDELDYLAKRLDSFVDSEATQFQGMAAKPDIAGIQDFINLTFCCQQATVITDFSDLAAVGRDHFMNLNGGCAKMEELEALDGYETALLLIDTGDGVVTPYGVVYDNGMKLEPLYDGYHFPAYYYDPPILALEVSTVQAGSTGALCLPMSDQQLQRARLRSEADGPYSTLTVTEDELPEEVSEALDLERVSGDDLPLLNRLCRAIKPMDELERKKLDAVVVMTETSGIFSICQLAENLEQFDFLPGVHSPEEYGKYMIQQSGHFEYDENLAGFYDYRRYGEQRVQEEGGQFNAHGYVAYQGTVPLEDLLLSDPAEQEQGPQMGGLS